MRNVLCPFENLRVDARSSRVFITIDGHEGELTQVEHLVVKEVLSGAIRAIATSSPREPPELPHQAQGVGQAFMEAAFEALRQSMREAGDNIDDFLRESDQEIVCLIDGSLQVVFKLEFFEDDDDEEEESDAEDESDDATILRALGLPVRQLTDPRPSPPRRRLASQLLEEPNWERFSVSDSRSDEDEDDDDDHYWWFTRKEISVPRAEKRLQHAARLCKKKSLQDSCSVCLEPLLPGYYKIAKDAQCVTLRECKHKFHRACLRSWTMVEDTCPLCRAKLRMQ